MDNFNNDFEDKDFDKHFVEVKSSSDKDKKPRGMGKKALSYVLVGVLCASLGGVAASVSTIKYYNSKQVTTNATGDKSNSKDASNSAVKTASNSVPLSVANIAKQVGPAVVGVSTKNASSVDLFGFPEQQEGMGSGIIFSEEGYILTNYHVVNGAKKITVIFNNGSEGKEIPAKLVNYDAAMDLAVIKLTENVKVPAVAQFGDSDSIQVGDPAIAIGNPLGKQFLGTVTSGVISAVNREVAVEGQKQKYLQTDAAINPGNSGGALVNIYGQVIGINTAKIGGSQIEGLGFAIPINAIKPKIQNLIKPVLKMGIGVINIDDKLSKEHNLPIGVYIQQIEEFSPAQKAGLLPGDVITKFDGKKVKTVQEINDLKQKHNSGDSVEVEITRDGKSKKLSLKLTD